MIANIQLLRAVSALLVVLHQVGVLVNARHAGAFNTNIGLVGVDIFFVISGFIIVYVADTREMGPREFLLGRIKRIVPLYWLATLVMLAMLTVGFQPIGLHGWTGWDLFASLYFLHTIRADGIGAPILSVGWTLAYEAFFYGGFGGLLFLRDSRTIVTALGALFGGLVLAGHWSIPNTYAWLCYTSPLLLEFVAGAVLAMVYLRTDWLDNPIIRSLAVPAIVLACLAICLADQALPDASYNHIQHRMPPFGVQAVMIVAAALVLERAGYAIKNATLLLLGTASYSLYLAHPLIILATWTAMSRLLPSSVPVATGIMAVSAVAAAIVGGLWVHTKIEKPLSSMIDRAVQAYRLRVKSNMAATVPANAKTAIPK